MKLLGYLASAFVLVAAAPAAAHVRLVYPPPRYPAPPSENVIDPQLKFAPCGVNGDSRTTDASRITTFAAGETITVEFEETIGHTGHYRIAFDDDGQDALQDPDGYEDIRPPGLPIILDGIADNPGAGSYEVEITLPNMACTNCTLQLIQVMTDKDPYGDGDDVYHQCADIVLTGGGSGGAGGGGSGGTAGTAGTPGSGGTQPTAGATGAGGVPTGSGGAASGGSMTTTSGGATTSGSGGSTTTPMQKALPESSCAMSRGGHNGRLGLWAFLALGLSLRRARLRRSFSLR